MDERKDIFPFCELKANKEATGESFGPTHDLVHLQRFEKGRLIQLQMAQETNSSQVKVCYLRRGLGREVS